MNYKIYTIVLSFTLFTSYYLSAQQFVNEVKIVGQMKNVMWKGELYGNIDLDTIANKEHLYGLGPVEYLAGEILIIDGKCYKSTVVHNNKMEVEETFNIKAPFFGYANISNWSEQSLPDSILTIDQLEKYLYKKSENSTSPFLFKLKGEVKKATFHIVNLPKGSKVSSPDEAHKGLMKFKLRNEKIEIIGFFSTAHKTIFTHHDTFLHMHLISLDRKKMGHIDDVFFKKGSFKICLPNE